MAKICIDSGFSDELFDILYSPKSDYELLLIASRALVNLLRFAYDSFSKLDMGKLARVLTKLLKHTDQSVLYNSIWATEYLSFHRPEMITDTKVY